MSQKRGPRSIDAQNPSMGDRAAELYRELGNAGKVAKILGCGRGAVTRMLNARGIVLRPDFDFGINVGDQVKCAGCGIVRTVNMSRGYSPHCRDCRPTIGEPRLGMGIRCGTLDGYRQHLSFGHPPCKPCRLAVKGQETPEPFPRCHCGRLVRSELGECSLCRRGITPKAPAPTASAGSEPVIHWVKGRSGIWRGIVQYEPQPDAPHQDPVVAESPDGYDEARVQRRILGDRSVRLRRGETAEVARRLTAERWSAAAIRRHTGVHPERYVRRDQTERAA